jgi:hypothetical protein
MLARGTEGVTRRHARADRASGASSLAWASVRECHPRGPTDAPAQDTPSGIGVALALERAHTASVPELVTALLIAILFAAPWIGAIALICWRAGGARLLWSEANEVFPTQSSQWRGISPR